MTSNESDINDSTSLKRKRERKQVEYNCERIKKSRVKNEEYENWKGNVVRPKEHGFDCSVAQRFPNGGSQRDCHSKGPHTPASLARELAREPGSTRLEMDQIRQCMDNKEPSRVKFRRAEPDPPLLAVRLGSARLEYQFASVWRITDRTRAPTTEKSVHSFFTTVRQTLRTTRSAKGKVFCLF
ncbi:hypothetical protein J6590_002726 [Homalodisca vitripennis]|nr:hypothetical protein J6590_002726 [Homalodisca vitripennis]